MGAQLLRVGEVAAREVVWIESTFLGAAKDRDDTPEGVGLLEMGEEVCYKADAGVVSESGWVVEGFGCF